MRIRKKEPSVGILGKIVNSFTNSKNDTYSADYINKLNEYSTDEQVIGTWIDGKPIYRKVILKEFINVPIEDFPLVVDLDIDFDKLINLKILYETSAWFGHDVFVSSKLVDGKSTLNNFMGKWVVSKSTKKVSIYGTLAVSETEKMTLYTIIEYTKTTD